MKGSLFITTCLSLWLVVVGMEVPITKYWKGGFKSEFCEPVTKELNNWKGHLVFDHHIDKLVVYKAELQHDLGHGKEFILVPSKGHFVQHSGDKICLHFTATVNDLSILPKVSFYIEGMDKTDSHGFVTPTPDPSGILWSKNDFNAQKPLDGFYRLPKGHFDEDSLSIVKDPEGGNGNVMKIFIEKGHYVKIHSHRGAQFYTSLLTPRDSMTLSYDVYFQKGMDFVIGGKLPGMYGGATNCTGGRHSDACLTTRFMWRQAGEGELYAYMPPPEDQVKNFCNSNNIICDPVYGISVGNGTWSFKTGRWENVAQHIHLNTPGHKDGYAIVWYNGKKVYEIRNVNFRNHDNIQMKGLFFSVFFGGGQPEWAPTADSNIYFKNFIVSSKEGHPSHPIG